MSKISQGDKKLKMRLDLAKFLEEQKYCKIAISGLLTPSQQLFCEKQAKQVVRNGDIKSKYSDDELNSDDSIEDGVLKHQTGTIHKDAMPYVDVLSDRLNPTDLRLLRHSIN